MIKTNSGKIFVVSMKDNNDSTEQTYECNIYATCEEHARQIFRTQYPDSTITGIYDDGICISQHYPEDNDIPEITLAEKLMFAMIGELSQDNAVLETEALNVIDTACAMTKMMMAKTIREALA